MMQRVSNRALPTASIRAVGNRFWHDRLHPQRMSLRLSTVDATTRSADEPSERKRIRREKWLDPVGTFRALPEPFRSLWLEDETSAALLRGMRRSEMLLTVSRIAASTSMAIFVATEIFLLSAGGPLNPATLALRALIASTTSVPLYMAANVMQMKVRATLTKQSSQLAHYQANRHAELARRARSLGLERTASSNSELSALEDLGNGMNRLLDSYRGLGESRSAGISAGTFSLFYTPFYSFAALLFFPPLLAYVLYRWKKLRSVSGEAEQQTREAARAGGRRDSSAAERTTIEGLRSARAAGLSEAAGDIHQEFVTEALEAQRLTTIARSRVEIGAIHNASTLTAMLMWCASVLAMPPAVVMGLFGTINVKASYAGPEAAFKQTLDDYVTKVQLAAETLDTLRSASGISPVQPSSTNHSRPPQYLDNPATSAIRFRSKGLVPRHGPSQSGGKVFMDSPVGTLTLIAGENRSGKSSLLEAIRYKVQAQAGTVSLYADQPVTQDQLDQEVALLRTTSKPHLEEMRRAWGITKDQQIKAMVEFGLEPKVAIDVVENVRPLSSLTEGEKVRVVMAPYICHCPQRVLMLDEPLAKLDPHAKRAFVQTAKAVAKKREIVILMASNEVEGIIDSDSILLLRRGARAAVQRTPSELFTPAGWPRWTRPFVVPNDPAVAAIRERLPIKDLLELRRSGESHVRAADVMIPTVHDAARVLSHFGSNLPDSLTSKELDEARDAIPTEPAQAPPNYAFIPELSEAILHITQKSLAESGIPPIAQHPPARTNLEHL